MPLSLLITLPSASTASSPSSCARVGPYLIVWRPPALVAIVPPTVAESLAARSTPYSRPAWAACALSSAIVTPARAVTRAGDKHPGHLVDVTRADHAARDAAEPARPVRGIPGGNIRIGEHVLR